MKRQSLPKVAEAPHRPAADRARHAPCGSTLVADVLIPFLGRHFRTSVTPSHTYSVKDKVALVTGGARGIGFETAKALSARGARVAVVDLDQQATAEAVAALGKGSIGIAADVTDAAAIRDVVAQVVERLGRLDVVVANAGIAPRAGTVRALGTADFERVLNVNVFGVYRTVQPALAHVIANGGHVVLISSIYAFLNGALLAPYAMSKAAVAQLGRALRIELAQHRATAGVVYFGVIDTAMVREASADPIASRFEATVPRFLKKRQHPSLAAAGIVDSIERRAARTFVPKRWGAFSLLRGLLNPVLDRRTERNATIQAIVVDADTNLDLQSSQ